MVQHIRIEDYSYPLPEEKIAKYPLPQRDTSKLLLYRAGEIQSHTFSDLPHLLPSGSLVVVNDTEVIRARLEFHRPSGGRVEVFCLDPIEPLLYEQALACEGRALWNCLVGNARKWKEPFLSRSYAPSSHELGELKVSRIGAATETGQPILFEWDTPHSFGEILSFLGELPIPPYLHRPTEESDLTTYQTVYAQKEGSVAAPTAGLHFTPEVLKGLSSAGHSLLRLTLHVGAGTFRPVKSEEMKDHAMHTERISVSVELVKALLASPSGVVAVGTTSVRTLESLYYIGVHLLEGRGASGESPLLVEQWEPYLREYPYTTEQALGAILDYLEREGRVVLNASTRIIIAPGFKFRLVEMLVTNFHQPRSTLLLLIAAFVGEGWREVYDYALTHDYRFLSYGDSSLLFRS